jgi:hypothetical protein
MVPTWIAKHARCYNPCARHYIELIIFKFSRGKGSILNGWIKKLLTNLDVHVDEATRKTIMGACGASCPFTHLTDDKLLEIKKNSNNDREFLDQLCLQWRMKNENEKYFVVFDQCYCPLVNEDTQGVSETLCYCTLGNIQHKFAIGLDRKVDVIMEKTILAGDEECRFSIQIDSA